MHNSEHVEARVIFKTGTIAKKIMRPDGKRHFLPYRVLQDVRLSKILATSTTFTFYLYQEDAEQAIQVAADVLLATWIKDTGTYEHGYPKLDGHGRAKRISDKEFAMTWQQADNQGKRIMKAGMKNDPVAFYIPDVSPIILPSFREFQLLKQCQNKT